MGQAGLKQQQLMEVPDAHEARGSERYALNEQTQSMRVPRDARRLDADVTQLIEINVLSPEELAWIDARRSIRPPEPTRGRTSAVFAKAGEDPSFSALRPFYREPTLERVQLQFEDRSLDPAANPLAHSSLRPPPRRALGITRALTIGVGALAVASVGYLAAVASWAGPQRGEPLLFPTRRVGVPHVVTLVAPPQPLAPSRIQQPAGVPATSEQPIPWSIDEASAAAPSGSAEDKSSAPAAPAAPSETPVSSVPSVSRRRLLALRARMQALQAASSAAAIEPVELPLEPTRDQIKVGIESVYGALHACAGAAHGLTTAHIAISGSGRVSSATIDGAFAGTPAGSCMARTLRSVTFPRFSSPSLRVTYPFRM